MDRFSREKRSEIMSKIHQPTRLEAAVHLWLEAEDIPHEMYPKVEGRPDIKLTLPDGSAVYVFVDGCFWHCCPLHYKRPDSNREYWVRHVEESNARREERRRRLPYRWIRIWEHEVESGEFKQAIRKLLATRKPGETG